MGATLGQWLVALWLAVTGVTGILYSRYQPLPPLSEPIEALWWVVGITSLAAALGVLRGAVWGRASAITVALLTAAWAIWVEVYWLRGFDLVDWLAEWRWLDLLIRVGLACLALWWLVKRWPSPQRAAA